MYQVWLYPFAGTRLLLYVSIGAALFPAPSLQYIYIEECYRTRMYVITHVVWTAGEYPCDHMTLHVGA